MKTAIGYSYLNGEKEHPRALTPWLPHVDYVIAVDGRYQTPLSPEMRRRNYSKYSTDNSYDVLEKLCGSKFIYDKFYTNQMEKRQRCLDIAGELECDYLITFDSDDYVHPDYQEWKFFRKQLELELKFPDHRIYDMWAWIPDEKLWSRQYNEIASNTWRQYPRIHKNPSTMRYAITHWTFTDKKVTDQEIVDFKYSHSPETPNPYFIKSSTTIDGIRITTDRTLRVMDDLEFGNSWTFQNMNWETYEFDTKLYYKNKPFTLVYEGLKRDRYPNLEYYFAPETQKGEIVGRLIPYFINEKGQYVKINAIQKADGSMEYVEEVLQEALAK